MSKPFPSITEKWHSESYPSIDPQRPELSAKGKVIAITGGGGSIGAETALSFAKAGATKIAVIGRREANLQETKKKVESEVKDAQILTVSGDIVDSSSISDAFNKIAKELGKIDILVAAAGYLSKFDNIANAEPDEWWTSYEINAKGTFNTCRAFLPASAENATLVYISTGPVHMPAMNSASAYITSKLAATKIIETFGSENPNLSIINVHPGVVYSEINLKSGIKAIDAADLPANFVVWAVSPEADFLRGKFLWCNWDVEELKSRKDELQKPDQLCITLNGWPFGQDSSDALTF